MKPFITKSKGPTFFLGGESIPYHTKPHHTRDEDGEQTSSTQAVFRKKQDPPKKKGACSWPAGKRGQANHNPKSKRARCKNKKRQTFGITLVRQRKSAPRPPLIQLSQLWGPLCSRRTGTGYYSPGTTPYIPRDSDIWGKFRVSSAVLPLPHPQNAETKRRRLQHCCGESVVERGWCRENTSETEGPPFLLSSVPVPSYFIQHATHMNTSMRLKK